MCTLEKRNNLFILTITGDDEHRLNPTLIDSIRSALNRVRSESSGKSTALITTAHGKFFSNGYDLAWATTATPPNAAVDRVRLMSAKLRSLVADLISLPLPTIAAVTGHAAAAGFVLALSHDYVLMRKDRGFLYMSELDIKLPVPAWIKAVLKAKIGSPAILRDVLMGGVKLTAAEAAARGVIDSAHDSAEETIRVAVELGERLVGRKWDGHVYGQIRKVVFAEALAAVGFDETMEDPKIVSRI